MSAVFVFLEKLKEQLDTAMQALYLPKDASRTRGKGVSSADWAPPTVYIGSLPPTGAEARAPFVLLQDTGGEYDAESGFMSVSVAIRIVTAAEDVCDACRDLHNIFSLISRVCAACRSAPLAGKYVLDPVKQGALLSWTRPDDQAAPYQEGYILTRWKVYAGI